MAEVDDDTGIIRTVATKIRAARKIAKLSQEELAHRAGVDRTYISQIERRQKNLTIKALAKVAAGLGVHPRDLL